MKFRRIAKNVANRLVEPWGMEFVSSHLVIHPENPFGWLSDMNIQTVLDIGANTGQFASRIRKVLPAAKIYSFEPLKDVYATLVANMSADKDFEAFNFALGDQDETTVIHRSGRSDSSSLLPMMQLHTDAWPDSAETGVETTEVRRLDGLELSLKPGLLVKMDVQGFEDRVISGGRETIGGAECVITEVSFDRLYEGQQLFDQLYCTLREMGFEYHGNAEQLLHPQHKRPLQADAIFLNAR